MGPNSSCMAELAMNVRLYGCSASAFGKRLLAGKVCNTSAIFPHNTRVGGDFPFFSAWSAKASSTACKKGRHAFASLMGGTCGQNTNETYNNRKPRPNKNDNRSCRVW